MKRPTFKEFVEAHREKEKIHGYKLKSDGSGGLVEDPLTDEQLLDMWNHIQTEPATELHYHGEITKLT